MDIKDVKTGIIYQTHWGYNEETPTILTLREDGKEKILHYIYEGKAFSFDSIHANLNGSVGNMTLATPSQIKWYNACVKKQAFVAFKDLNLIKLHELWI